MDMKWNNLKSMKCPKIGCKGDLQHIVSRGIECKNCPFIISHAKFEEIVAKMYVVKRYSSDLGMNNQSALNNFGHKEYSKDYSDEIENL